VFRCSLTPNIRKLAYEQVGAFIDQTRLQLSGAPLSNFMTTVMLAVIDDLMTAFLLQHKADLIPQWKELHATLGIAPMFGSGEGKAR
jgi:hypothetical protein